MARITVRGFVTLRPGVVTLGLLLLALLAHTGPAQAGIALTDVEIEKLVNGLEADAPPGVFVPVGSTVTFTYRVTLVSGLPVDVSVRDDNGTPGLLGDDFTPTFSGGDTTANGLLDFGETWTFSAALPAVAGQHTNIAVVFQSNDGLSPFDEDPGNYFGQVPDARVPSPAPLVLLGSGLAALAYLGRRRPASRP